jgi:hypothetical protein
MFLLWLIITGINYYSFAKYDSKEVENGAIEID